jgi:hypothetical protein
MRHISPLKSGAAVGAVIALWHLVWVTLVGLGYAKPVLDFILRLHFIDLQYRLEPYAVSTASTLVLLTFALGAVFGALFAVIWNSLNKESTPARQRQAA